MERHTMNAEPNRRAILAAGGALLTTSIFTGKVKGANDRLAIAIIGMGNMGTGHLRRLLKMPEVAVKSVCDVYAPNLERAVAAANGQVAGVKDFREILADKSVDAVCIAAPDHWHAYITIEACKAGKDVYVEKPLCRTVEEGVKMVKAARQYQRVVQAGTQHRSSAHLKQACGMVSAGELGAISFVRAWNYGNVGPEGIGNPPDSEPPQGLDWDMWVGPAPMRPFNPNRYGRPIAPRSQFHWFWDYGGGMMTNWGVHWLDTVQMALGEAMPKAATAVGGKFCLRDNRETPDTIQAVYEYPTCAVVYENRLGNSHPNLGQGNGISFHGAKGTLFLDRQGFRVLPEEGSALAPLEVKATDDMVQAHWNNFLECVRTRQKPAADVEICQRATTTCLLGNIAFRAGMRVDWDARNWTTVQPEARRWLSREERPPWRIVV